MPEARKLMLRGHAQVLAESAAGEPFYAVLDRPAGPEGKVVILTVDLDKSDLPLQTAFPIMMANLLSWFGGAKGELREALPAGAVAQVEIPLADAGSHSLLPGGTRRPRASLVRRRRHVQGHRRPARSVRSLECCRTRGSGPNVSAQNRRNTPARERKPGANGDNARRLRRAL